MIVFWIAVGVISTAVAGLILGRAAQAAAAPQGSDSTLPLYRRQLAEIDEPVSYTHLTLPTSDLV